MQTNEIKCTAHRNGTEHRLNEFRSGSQRALNKFLFSACIARTSRNRRQQQPEFIHFGLFGLPAYTVETLMHGVVLTWKSNLIIIPVSADAQDAVATYKEIICQTVFGRSPATMTINYCRTLCSGVHVCAADDLMKPLRWKQMNRKHGNFTARKFVVRRAVTRNLI